MEFEQNTIASTQDDDGTTILYIIIGLAAGIVLVVVTLLICFYCNKCHPEKKDTPAQAIDTPAQAIGTPAQAIGTPAQATGTPAQAIGTPAQAIGTPARATTPISRNDPHGMDEEFELQNAAPRNDLMTNDGSRSGSENERGSVPSTPDVVEPAAQTGPPRAMTVPVYGNPEDEAHNKDIIDSRSFTFEEFRLKRAQPSISVYGALQQPQEASSSM